MLLPTIAQGQCLFSRQTNGSAVSQTGWTISQNPDNSKLDYRYEARTANTLLVSSDRSKFINITSGTFTQTFDAAASLSAGWYVRIKNSGTSDITLGSFWYSDN